MAKAARKKAKKKAVKKPAKRSAKVAKAKGKADLDPNQASLNGFEGDRVPEVENVIGEIVMKQSEAKRLTEEVAERISEIPPLFRKFGLNSYTCLGKHVTIEPGEDVVKILKAKKKN